MLESFLKMLNGEKIDEFIWTADVTYWIDGQTQLSNIFRGLNTEKGYLEFCKELGVMPYYWYGPEGCWFGNEICLSTPRYEKVEFESKRCGNQRITTIKTPVGQLEQRLCLSEQTCSAAFTKYFVKTREDLKILLHILQNRYLAPSPIVSTYKQRVKLWEQYDGIPSAALPRSPISALLTEWAGVENGIYLVMDCADIVTEILDILEEQEKPILDAVCQLAPQIVHFTDNLTSDTYTGLFDEFMKPRYERRLKKLHSANVKVAVHLDGTVRGLLPKLAEVGFDAVEALTPKPAGDLEIEQMRGVAKKEDVILWGGIPGAIFSNPYTWNDVKKHAEKVLESWNGQRFVLGVADQVPPDGDITMVKKISDLLKYWK